MVKVRPGQYVRDYYGVPAFIGRPVVFTWDGRHQGKITGFKGAYLLIKFDDAAENVAGEKFHPTWEIEYPLDLDAEPLESDQGT